MPRHYVNTALGQMHVRTQGSGPPLLLLGSAGRSARMFDHLIPLLSERFQLIAPDMFGHGNSDEFAGSRVERGSAASQRRYSRDRGLYGGAA